MPHDTRDTLDTRDTRVYNILRLELERGKGREKQPPGGLRQMKYSIKVSALTKNRLLGLMRPQETYDEVVVRLLEELACRALPRTPKKGK